MIIRTLALFICICLNTFCSDAQQAELEVQTGHTSRIKHMRFSNNGKYLVTAALENKVIVWDLATKMQLRTLNGHTHYIESLSISDDSKYIISGSVDKTARLWDIASGKCVRIFTGFKHSVTLALFSPGGHQVLLGGEFGELKLYDTKTGEKKSDLIGHKEAVLTAAFTPDGTSIYTAGYGSYLYRWTVSSGESKYIMSPHSMPVLSLAISPDGESFVTSDSDKKLVFWSTRSSIFKRIITLDNTAEDIQFLTADTFCFKKGDHSIAYARFAYQEIFRTDTVPKEIYAYAFNKNTGTLATATSEMKIDLWMADKMLQMGTLQSRSMYLNSVVANPVTPTFAGAYSDNNIRIWNLPTANIIRVLKGHTRMIKDMKFTADGKTLISGGNDKTIIAWNTEDGSIKYKRADYDGYIESIDLYEEQDIMAVATVEKKIYLQKISTGKDLQSPLSGDLSNIRTVAFSPDKRYLAAACGIWNIQNGKKDQGYIALWNIAKGTETEFIETGTGMLQDLAFSPYGDKVAVVSEDGFVKVIDMDTRQVSAAMQTLDNYMKKVVWLDDDIVITGDRSGDILIWDTRTSKLIKHIAAHASFIEALSFTNDRSRLISCSDDNTIRLWDIKTYLQQASFVALSDSSYIAITPANYYLTNRAATNGIAFRKDGGLFSFSQFDLQFNRPDLLLRSIGYASDTLIESYHKAYLKRLKRAGLDESAFSSDMHVPVVSIAGKEKLSGVSKNEKLNFVVAASDEKYQLRSLLISVNGVPYHQPSFVLKTATKEFTFNVSLPLSEGENTVECSVLNEKGAESYREIFNISYHPATLVTSNVYFVGIGINRYKDATMNLTYAQQDIRDMASIIRKKYPKAIIDTLLNENATKQNILALKRKLLQTSVNDKVIVSISGHGLLDKSLNFYFATHDINFSDPSLNGLLYDELEDLLSGIPARKKLLLIDACHSGEVDKNDDVTILPDTGNVKEVKTKSSITVKKKVGLQNSFELMKELFADLSRSNGAAIISAAGGYEYAFEDAKYNNGVFTYCLKKGLMEMVADANNDGSITVNELKDFVSRQVSDLTAGKQKPTSRRDLEYDWVIW